MVWEYPSHYFAIEIEEAEQLGLRMANFHSVVEQILEIGEKYPDSTALDHAGLQLTYQQLVWRANRFGGYLVQLGVLPGETVAICMERSFDWIVAALGVMRIGAAYVPLDCAWPDSRLRFAVNDSGASALVGRPSLLDRLQVKARGIDPGRDSEFIVGFPVVSRDLISPRTLAYMIYTSGSTGVPKGVEITHANLAHLVRWHLGAFNVTNRDRASHLAGLGFDAAVWEIWPNLCAGATVCLAEDSVRSSAELIQRWIIRECVTISFVPTVHATQLMAIEWPAETPLRLLLTGGDVLNHGPARALPFEVVNNYGPTECTVVATSAQLRPGSDGLPPIGRPIAGATVYLLNEDGQQAPEGSIGEIYIGGEGVAHGYHNLPDLTARSFLPDPYAESLGSRMYRTGDRGVRRPDGEIEFCGRLDRQVKIRGQRIELDEIGRVLVNHPKVEFGTAIFNHSYHGENRLIAYILPKNDASPPTSDELQQYLQHTLPDYMIPAIFVRLSALPLSLNGKLDLTMLDKPSEGNRLRKSDTKLPTTTAEEKVLRLVREILENDDISTNENFFLAGGHSLLGMQLVLRLGEVFGVNLTLQQLFAAPTAKQLAASIEMELTAEHLVKIWSDLLGQKQIKRDDDFFDQGGNAELVAALRQRIDSELDRLVTVHELLQNPTLKQQVELIHGQVQRTQALPPGIIALQPQTKRNVVFWVHSLSGSLAKAVGEDRPFVFVRLTEEDLLLLGETPTFASIAACMVGKILATQANGPYTIGGFCLGGVLAFEIASQLRGAGHEVSLLVLVDPPNPSALTARNPLTPRLSNPGYLVKRLMRLGIRAIFGKLRERIVKRFYLLVKARLDDPLYLVFLAQQRIETAATLYRPGKYDGRALLLLAHDHPPHLDFLPGWQSIIPNDLHAEYVYAHHSELLTTQTVLRLADTILSHLRNISDQEHTCQEYTSTCDASLMLTTAASSGNKTE
jgi:amino acid adenylation domain-containing protein